MRADLLKFRTYFPPRPHRHRFLQTRLEDTNEYLKSRGLKWDQYNYWYEKTCVCGEVQGEPYLGD